MLLERLRAETDPACSREEEDLSYRPHTGAGATTLTNTSAIENLPFSEYEDLLVLAQQHFDDLRRTFTNRSGEGRRPGSNVHRPITYEIAECKMIVPDAYINERFTISVKYNCSQHSWKSSRIVPRKRKNRPVKLSNQ